MKSYIMHLIFVSMVLFYARCDNSYDPLETIFTKISPCDSSYEIDRSNGNDFFLDLSWETLQIEGLSPVYNVFFANRHIYQGRESKVRINLDSLYNYDIPEKVVWFIETEDAFSLLQSSLCIIEFTEIIQDIPLSLCQEGDCDMLSWDDPEGLEGNLRYHIEVLDASGEIVRVDDVSKGQYKHIICGFNHLKHDTYSIRMLYSYINEKDSPIKYKAFKHEIPIISKSYNCLPYKNLSLDFEDTESVAKGGLVRTAWAGCSLDRTAVLWSSLRKSGQLVIKAVILNNEGDITYGPKNITEFEDKVEIRDEVIFMSDLIWDGSFFYLLSSTIHNRERIGEGKFKLVRFNAELTGIQATSLKLEGADLNIEPALLLDRSEDDRKSKWLLLWERWAKDSSIEVYGSLITPPFTDSITLDAKPISRLSGDFGKIGIRTRNDSPHAIPDGKNGYYIAYCQNFNRGVGSIQIAHVDKNLSLISSKSLSPLSVINRTNKNNYNLICYPRLSYIPGTGKREMIVTSYASNFSSETLVSDVFYSTFDRDLNIITPQKPLSISDYRGMNSKAGAYVADIMDLGGNLNILFLENDNLGLGKLDIEKGKIIPFLLPGAVSFGNKETLLRRKFYPYLLSSASGCSLISAASYFSRDESKQRIVFNRWNISNGS